MFDTPKRQMDTVKAVDQIEREDEKTGTIVPVFLRDTNRIMGVTLRLLQFSLHSAILFVKIKRRQRVKKRGIRMCTVGGMLVGLFALWTMVIQTVDVQPIGPMGTKVGLAALNGWVHGLSGVHMQLYAVTDWMGIVPIFVCAGFGWLGMLQLFKRRSLRKVDFDLILLGGYYLLVISAYLVFEKFPVNYRPVLIEGRLEASYPSSTTLLVLSVIPTLVFQIRHRAKSTAIKRITAALSVVFSAFMVVGRLIAGVHWVSDIIGGILLSAGMFCIYRGLVVSYWKENKREVLLWNFPKSCRNCESAEE